MSDLEEDFESEVEGDDTDKEDEKLSKPVTSKKPIPSKIKPELDNSSADEEDESEIESDEDLDEYFEDEAVRL